jgi:2-polyprenyl-3-methyl-5-hydroxy-6-metoxy-1,4-benzoquinol methylase
MLESRSKVLLVARVVRAIMPYGLVVALQQTRWNRNRLLYGSWRRPWNVNTEVYWDNRLREVSDFWRDEPYHVLCDYLPTDAEFSLLDVGCATGDGCEYLAAHFPKASLAGVDISPVGIQKARAKRSSVAYSVADVTQTPLTGSWDFITIVETLEHITDAFAVVDNAVRCARRAVFISVPCEDCGSTALIAEGGEHVWTFDDSAFDPYGGEVLVRDVLNDGTMPRALFRVPGRSQRGSSEELRP